MKVCHVIFVALFVEHVISSKTKANGGVCGIRLKSMACKVYSLIIRCATSIGLIGNRRHLVKSPEKKGRHRPNQRENPESQKPMPNLHKARNRNDKRCGQMIPRLDPDGLRKKARIANVIRDKRFVEDIVVTNPSCGKRAENRNIFARNILVLNPLSPSDIENKKKEKRAKKRSPVSGKIDLKPIPKKMPIKKLKPKVLARYTAHRKFGKCRLRDFTLGKCIEKGSFGSVCQARHNPTNTVVAIKKIDHLIVRNKHREILIEEAIHHSLANRFISKHFCTIETTQGNIYLVLEYFPGGDLQSRVRKIGKFGQTRVVKIVAQLIIALRYLHKKKIAHRDIKASNVLLDSNGNVKLIDFGLARKDGHDCSTYFAGTIVWAAPEVIRASNKCTFGRPADYYSVGILAYYLYMGVMPCENISQESFSTMLSRRQTEDVIIPSTRSKYMDQLIKTLTTTNPAHRWRMVYEDFANFTKLPIFSSFDWSTGQSKNQDIVSGIIRLLQPK